MSTSTLLRRSSRQRRPILQITDDASDSDTEDEKKQSKKKRTNREDDEELSISSSNHSSDSDSKSIETVKKKKSKSSLESQEPFKCLLCPVMLSSKEEQKAHLEKEHSTKGHDGVGYRCDEPCGKLFSSQHLFTKHLKRIHLPYTNLPYTEKRRKKIPDGRPCEICGKNILFEKNYILHQEYHERNRNDPTKTEECPVCHIWFKKQRIHLHMTLHKNPFLCKFAGCGKKFDGRPSLEKHVQLHMADRKPINCPYCPGKYSLQKYLKMHLKRKHSAQNKHKEIVRVQRNVSYFVQPVHGLVAASADKQLPRPRRKYRYKGKKCTNKIQTDDEDTSAEDDSSETEEEDETTSIKEERIELESVHFDDDQQSDPDTDMDDNTDDDDVQIEPDTKPDEHVDHLEVKPTQIIFTGGPSMINDLSSLAADNLKTTIKVESDGFEEKANKTEQNVTTSVKSEPLEILGL